MAGKPDTMSIGADKAIQDPADAMDGRYTDPVESIPIEDRYQQRPFPEAPEPTPFSLNPETAPGGRVSGT